MSLIFRGYYWGNSSAKASIMPSLYIVRSFDLNALLFWLFSDDSHYSATVDHVNSRE